MQTSGSPDARADGTVIRSRTASEAHQRLIRLVAAAEAERQEQALLDVRSDEPVIDLRDRTLDLRPPPPRTGPDPVLVLVVNRVRHRLFGVRAVRAVGPDDHALTELAALTSRSTPPDLEDLVRQRFARRSLRRGAAAKRERAF